jgi:pimeloyl-ACP methyl ester carboxylesterase
MASMREVELSAGPIRYRESGEGPPIVFVHGLLVDGELWRNVTPGLEDRFRCIVPDWPLGSHTLPMREDADMSPRGVARLIGDFLEALDLRDVTLVGNDTGGALSQLLVTERPERVGRLVLTPCDAFDNFPPRMFRPLLMAARVPGAPAAILQLGRLHAIRRLPNFFGWLIKHGVPKDVSAAWVEPGRRNPAIRRDVTRFLRAIDPKETVAVAERLHTFDRPVLLAWPPEDRFFPFEHARRLAELFPDARVEEVPDSYSFVSEDQPERLAALIREFAEPAPEPAPERERSASST